MLYSRFGINYNELPARFRKGSVLVREEVCPGDRCESRLLITTGQVSDTVETRSGPETDKAAASDPGEPAPTSGKKAQKKPRVRTTVELYHCDIIGDEFWDCRPNLLADS